MEAAAPFTFGPGGWHAEVVLAIVVVAWLYTRWWRTSAPLERARPVAFLGALLALLLALNGPLHDLSDDYLFSAHMVQHLMLTLVVAPLALAGTPPALADALLRPLLRWRAIGTGLRTLTRPVPAFALYAIALIGWHLPGPYDAAVHTHALHIVEHVVLLGTATLGWWPVVSPSSALPALPYGAQLLYLFVFGMPMTVVAAFVTAAEQPLYRAYAAAPRLFGLSALADQRLGGVIMWVPAGVIPVLAFTVVFFRWVAAEAEEAA